MVHVVTLLPFLVFLIRVVFVMFLRKKAPPVNNTAESVEKAANFPIRFTGFYLNIRH